jgi:hypothetical protein
LAGLGATADRDVTTTGRPKKPAKIIQTVTTFMFEKESDIVVKQLFEDSLV